MASKDVFADALEAFEELEMEDTFVPDIKKLFISILKEISPTKRSIYAEKVKEFWDKHEQLYTVLVFNTDETCDTKEELRKKIINQDIKKGCVRAYKKEKLTELLRENRIKNNDEVPEIIGDGLSKIKILNKHLKRNNNSNMRITFLIGETLSMMKRNGNLNFSLLKSEVSYSKVWIKFLLKIYKLINKYNGFIQCGTPLYILQKNITLLPHVLEEHKEEWEILF